MSDTITLQLSRQDVALLEVAIATDIERARQDLKLAHEVLDVLTSYGSGRNTEVARENITWISQRITRLQELLQTLVCRTIPAG
ncbi:MAG: hypothetical protein M3Y79_12010 [Pseudomonadota bacterium]|nr:hypothetical protein [Pseudomonadota bacterium]